MRINVRPTELGGSVRAVYRLSRYQDRAVGWLPDPLDVAMGNVHATLTALEGSSAVDLELLGDAELGDMDCEAERVASVFAFMLQDKVGVCRTDPKPGPELITGSFQTLRVLIDGDWIDEKRSMASRLLVSADPRLLPGWQTYLLAVSTRDAITRFVLLWAVLDLLLEATTVAQVDSLLHSPPHCLPREFPGKGGAPDCETFPTFCRQRLGHAFGRQRHWDPEVLAPDCLTASRQLIDVIDHEFRGRLGV